MGDLDFSDNIARFTGFAALYDSYRPSPPEALAEVLRRYAGNGELTQVVDLGCGTGLSTRYWSGHARRVTGVDPTAAMLETAAQAGGENIAYVTGFSHATSLPDHGADLVTCSQSLHWMDPSPTFHEIARILRSGGVFAAYDYNWPPATGFWELDALYEDCVARSHEMESSRKLDTGLQKWGKEGHLSRMEGSSAFRYVRELAVHHADEGDAERLVGLIFSQGHIQTLMKNGVTEEELGIDQLRELATRKLGIARWPWLWTSRVRLGIV